MKSGRKIAGVRSLVLALTLLVAFVGRAFCATPASEVPPVRVAALSKGVNLGHWFSQLTDRQPYGHEHFRNWITAGEFSALYKAGFTHVRFPVEFEMFFDEQHPSVLRPEFLSDFDQALDKILGAGLAVDVDFHARNETKERLCKDDAFAGQVAELWGAVARHLATRDPNRVFLETMNEPIPCMTLPRWLNIQAKFLSAIRAADPNKTVIVTADRWDSINELADMKPLSDRNVVYTIHLYEPIFTRQGATWANGEDRDIKGLAYPADEANKTAVASRIADPKARAKVLGYYGNRGELADKAAVAANWARKYGVPVYCGEFGVYGKYAPSDSRMRWLSDVRGILEKDNMSWSMWDYSSEFGVVLGDKPGHRSFDPAVLQALGLSEASAGRH